MLAEHSTLKCPHLPTVHAPSGPGILFDLPADRLPAFAASVRRLTGQPLQLHWLPTGDDESGRVLVHIESPPAILVDRAAGIGRVLFEPSRDIPPASEFVGEIESLGTAGR